MILMRHLALAMAVCVATATTATGQSSLDLDRAHHVLRRVTFGPTTELVNRLTNPPPGMTPLQEVQAFLAEQLNPARTADPYWPYGSQDVRDMVKPGGWLGVPNATGPGAPFVVESTTGAQLMYGLDSKWQIREVMTQFWERHFNTGLIGGDFYFEPYRTPPQRNSDFSTWFEWEANQHYRDHAFDTFHSLLEFTSKHVTMVVYLHLYQNIVASPTDKPNEDFARELLELYTMGPRWNQGGGVFVSNYDQADIETVARILSGWGIDPANNFNFLFTNANHDTSTKPPMFGAASGVPYSLPAGTTGLAEGERLLQHLAGRDATKDFICRKLIDYFLADGAADQQSGLLAAMKGAWGTSGDIRAVLNVLFSHNGIFLDPYSAYARDRARLPLEIVLAPPRAFGGRIDRTNPLTALESLIGMWGTLEAMGQPLLRYPAPNGYPQASRLQHSPSIAVLRTRYAASSFFDTSHWFWLDFDLTGYFAVPTTSPDPVAIGRKLLGSLYGSGFSTADELAVLQAMGNMTVHLNANPVAPTPSHLESILRAGAAAAMTMAQGQIR